jgi:hypothetical protein
MRITQSKKRIQKKKQFNTKRKKKKIIKKGGSFSSDTTINKEQAVFFFGHSCIIGGDKALFKLPVDFKLYTTAPTNCVAVSGCNIRNFNVIAERYQLLLNKHQHKLTESTDFPVLPCVLEDDYTVLHMMNDILTNKINVPSDLTSLSNCVIRSKEGTFKKTNIHLWTDEDWVPDMYLSVFETESLIKDTFARYGFIHFNDNHLLKKSSEGDEYDTLEYKHLFVPKNKETEEELYSNNRLYYSPTLMNENERSYTFFMNQFLKKEQPILLSNVIYFLNTTLNIKELYIHSCRKMCSPEDKDIITLANERSIDGIKRVDSRKESEESIKRTDSIYKIKKSNMDDTHISYETLLKNINDDKVMLEDDEIPTMPNIEKMNIEELEIQLELLDIYEVIHPDKKTDIKKSRADIEQHIEKLKK